MADRILIQCPGCSTKLALSDATKLGKKIRCSRCSEVFVTKALKSSESNATKTKPKKSDDEFGFDDMELEDQSEPEVRSRHETSKSGVSKKKSKEKKSTGANLPLLVGGIVAVLLLLGVGGFFLLGGKGDLPAQPAAGQPSNTVSQPPIAQAGTPSPATQIQSAPGQPQASSIPSTGSLRPGEVLASNAADLPAGTRKLSVQAEMGRTEYDFSLSNDVPTIKLLFTLDADYLQKACAYGKVEITTARLNNDRNASIRKGPYKLANDPEFFLIPYEQRPNLKDYPAGLLGFGLTLSAMDEPVTELALIEGRFKVTNAKKVEQIEIPDVRAAANRPVEHPSLKAADVTITLESVPSKIKDVSNQEVLNMTIGPNHAFGLLATISGGRYGPQLPIDANATGEMEGRRFTTVQSLTLPEKMSLTFNLFSEIETTEVPFRFENVPILTNPKNAPKR